MTTAELLRLLKKNGCKLVGHNKKHDMYWSPITGNTFMVGRHSKEEVRSGTAQAILKAAGIK
jgi:predicted RNA binding protein YcfA (HicA-like mRNA interferase family)